MAGGPNGYGVDYENDIVYGDAPLLFERVRLRLEKAESNGATFCTATAMIVPTE